MEFKVLGTIEVTEGGLPRTPSAPKIRQVLAVLLVRANLFTSVDALIDELWGNSPPVSAVTTVHTYVHNLRKQLTRNGPDGSTTKLTTEQQGYVFQVADKDLDASMFLRLTEDGGHLMEANRPNEAARRLRAGLALWRGPVACGVNAGQMLRARAAHLDEVRLQATELWIQAESALGRLRQIIPDLRSLVAANPYHEGLHAHLISALQQAGRRADALEAYQRFRQVLATDLGLEPSSELRQLQHSVLAEDGVVPVPAPRPTPRGPAGRVRPVERIFGALAEVDDAA
jgi:SARP family transcriptional regulator, regulator of embCAB operon